MDIYREFAEVYDIFMNNIPYDSWIKYIESIWKTNNLKPKLVLDLACGTGNITCRLQSKGYDMIGIDISCEMLMKAKQKADENNQDILFLEQDIRKFELYGTVESCICMSDSLNYILEEHEIFQIFKLINNYLNSKGLFIFDLNTEYKFKNILGSNNFTYTSEEASYIWENYYYEEEKINEYYMTFFILDKRTKLYKKYKECHFQKAYDIEKIIYLIDRSGLKLLKIYNELTFSDPNETSERVVFVVRKD